MHIDYWAIVEPHWERVSIYDGPDVFIREFDATREVARNLLAAHWCIAEIENGGFYQFLTNSTGILGPEAVVGLRAVGLSAAADIVNRVVSLFGNPYPRDRDERGEMAYRLASTSPMGMELFEDEDSKFYDAVDSAAAMNGGGWVEVMNRYAGTSQ